VTAYNDKLLGKFFFPLLDIDSLLLVILSSFFTSKLTFHLRQRLDDR